MISHPDSDEMVPVGDLFMRNISFDDWIHDMSSRTLDPEDCEYYGHQYRVDLEYARDNPQFKKNIRSRLAESDWGKMNKSGERRADQMGAPNKVDLRPQCILWEYYFPKENVIVTTSEFDNEEPLSEVDWYGPQDSAGPYNFLYYTEVMDNSMPLQPAAVWYDLHRLANNRNY